MNSHYLVSVVCSPEFYITSSIISKTRRKPRGAGLRGPGGRERGDTEELEKSFFCSGCNKSVVITLYHIMLDAGLYLID